MGQQNQVRHYQAARVQPPVRPAVRTVHRGNNQRTVGLTLCSTSLFLAALLPVAGSKSKSKSKDCCCCGHLKDCCCCRGLKIEIEIERLLLLLRHLNQNQNRKLFSISKFVCATTALSALFFLLYMFVSLLLFLLVSVFSNMFVSWPVVFLYLFCQGSSGAKLYR